MRRIILLTAMLIAAAPGLFPDLTIGLMPAENSFPLVVAAEKGYFAQEGVKVTLVLFSSQLNREAALHSGSVDGSISDLINAVQSRANGAEIMVTSASEGAFSLLASPRSTLTGVDAWKKEGRKVRTGLLENSIVLYVTEKLLLKAKADPGTIELVPIVPVPVRMEMLIAGQIEAACLPEPMGAVAENRGARRIADSSGLDSTPGVILFTRRAIEAKPTELRAFYRAYNRAVAETNANGSAYRAAIVEACELPRELAGTLRVPAYRAAFVPSPRELEEVASWMLAKGLIRALPRYEDIVLAIFLP
jgi:NitT/TauT family transport system substrate-binding protein